MPLRPFSVHFSRIIVIVPQRSVFLNCFLSNRVELMTSKKVEVEIGLYLTTCLFILLDPGMFKNL